MTVTSGYVLANGRMVFYRRWPGHGVPIVLVHGLAASHANWGALPDRLCEQGFAVTAVDLPGHGASEHNPGQQSIPCLARALGDAVDQLELENPYLVGHSLGGVVSSVLAYERPERVSGLTLNAAAGLGPGAMLLLRGGLLPGASLGMRLAVTKPAVHGARLLSGALRTLGVAPYELSPTVLDVLGGLTEADRQAGFMETLHQALTHPDHPDTVISELATLDGRRISIVWCSSDPVLPSDHAHTAHAQLPGSHLHVFAGHSHEPHNHAPDRFLEVVIDHARACSAL